MKRFFLLFTACTLFISIALQAGNWTFLRQGNQARILMDEDQEQFYNSLENALDDLDLDESLEWNSNTTGNSGSFKLLQEFTYENLSCRKLGMRILTAARQNKFVHSFCRDDESWKILK